MGQKCQHEKKERTKEKRRGEKKLGVCVECVAWLQKTQINKIYEIFVCLGKRETRTEIKLKNENKIKTKNKKKK